MASFGRSGSVRATESSAIFGAGDGDRTNPIGQNKGVTARFSVQLESNGVKLLLLLLWDSQNSPKWRQHEKNKSIENSRIVRFPTVRDEYLKSLAIKGFSENTLRIREIYIGMFLRWCETSGIISAREVTDGTLLRFQEHLYLHRKTNGHPLSTSSQYSRLALIRLWFQWMHRQGHIRHDPTKALELPRTAYKLPTVLTKQQVEKVLAQPDARKLVGIRDRAIMEVLYSTGIRRMELIGLRIVDLDRERGVVTIREGKGKRDRTVPIGERAVAWLDQYLSRVRPAISTEPDTGLIFLTSTGASFTPNHLSGY